MSETAVEPSSSVRLTLFHIALLLPWIAVVVTAFQRVVDNSFLWHIRAGELQLAEGSVLTSDPFSFAMAGEPWRTQSWLVELIYAWFEGWAGIGFAGWLILLVATVTVFGVGLVAYRHSRSIPATAVVLILSAVLLPHFLVPRPVIFSYLFFVLVILAWERQPTRWGLPFLFWLWSSVHGSFVIGLGYLVLRAIQAREWQAWRVILVSSTTTLMTAHGFGVFEMLWDFVQARPYLAFIGEWQTPNLLELAFLPMLLGIFIVVYGAIRGRLDVNSLWVFVPFLALALSAERTVIVGWIALIPLISLGLGNIDPSWVREFSRPIGMGFVLLIALFPVLFIEAVELDRESFPVAAVAELEDVRTFHDDYAGGYLIWLDGPEKRVYIDDRAELYQERLQEFVEVRAAKREWREVFERDRIEQVLLEEDDALLNLLEAEGWGTVYRDERYVVMRP